MKSARLVVLLAAAAAAVFCAPASAENRRRITKCYVEMRRISPAMQEAWKPAAEFAKTSIDDMRAMSDPSAELEAALNAYAGLIEGESRNGDVMRLAAQHNQVLALLWKRWTETLALKTPLDTPTASLRGVMLERAIALSRTLCPDETRLDESDAFTRAKTIIVSANDFLVREKSKDGQTDNRPRVPTQNTGPTYDHIAMIDAVVARRLAQEPPVLAPGNGSALRLIRALTYWMTPYSKKEIVAYFGVSEGTLNFATMSTFYSLNNYPEFLSRVKEIVADLGDLEFVIRSDRFLGKYRVLGTLFGLTVQP